jgi:hypothetical protein
MQTKSISPRSALLLCWALLLGIPLVRAADASRESKIAELMQLTGVAQRLAESNLARQATARKRMQTLSQQMLAKMPPVPPQERARIEDAATQLQRDADTGVDHEDAVGVWGRFYSQNLTDADLDAILRFYRSPAGQKDVSATSAAIPQFQHYLDERNAASLNAAVAKYTAALRSIIDASNAAGTPGRPWDSDPTAPDGLVIAHQTSAEQCEIAQPVQGVTHAVPSTGRSLVCVCIDEKGTLTRNPVIAESSGDSRVDAGAVKMARSESGRYEPPSLGGQPQRGCFRFAIDFRHPQ